MRLEKGKVCMVMNDIILNKIMIIERCVNRVYEVYNDNPKNLANYTKQDSIVLNIQRACEASIDLAMFTISQNKLGVPKASLEAFQILYESEIINEELADSLKTMVGFLNIAVHDYQSLDLDILEKIIEKHISDFKDFTKIMIKLEK